MTDDATARRQRLGRTLRKLRVKAGLTQSAVATALGCGQAKVNKIETTLCRITGQLLDELIDLYGVEPDEAARLREWAALDLRDSPARTAGNAYTVLTDRELEADEILCWHSERIPGPLKSERYALAQRGPGLTDDQVTEVLRRHKARMQVLTKTDPPRYRVILSESSLYRLPGGFTADMVNDQASHLLNLMATYSRLELRILPFTAKVTHVDTDFQLLLFDSAEIPNFAYFEGPGGPRRDEKANLEGFHNHWTMLSAEALDVAATKEFLSDLLS